MASSDHPGILGEPARERRLEDGESNILASAASALAWYSTP